MLEHKYKTTRKFWPFEPIDSYEIYNYINKLSKEGLALKKVWLLIKIKLLSIPINYIFPFLHPKSEISNYLNYST